MRRALVLMACVLALLGSAQAQSLASSGIDLGFRQLYNLEFSAAQQTFAAWISAHPADPLGPAAAAAGQLFLEMDRLHILQAQFFTDDHRFLAGADGAPDPVTAAAFAANLDRSRALAAQALHRRPGDENALFSQALCDGLDADFQALIQHHTLAALRLMKHGQAIAERLISAAPDNYDAELALGLENYVLGLKPAPIRWLLRLDGATTNQAQGIAQLEAVALHGHLLRPYAKILLALAALRARDSATATHWLEDLAQEFPANPLYAQELHRLAAGAAPGWDPRPVFVQLDPTATSIHFTLGAFLHTVHGTMALTSGVFHFDPATGAASGFIVINAASASTGNADRDRTMHHDVLKSDRYPQIVFAPDSVSPVPAARGSSQHTLHGIVTIAGQSHAIAFPATVDFAANTVTASASFTVPYVAWGLHNPSTLFLRVANSVQITLCTQGTITPADRAAPDGRPSWPPGE